MATSYSLFKKIMTQEQIAKLSDRELFQQCRLCGTNIRKFLKEFAVYLPEVAKRRLYKKYGCHTLYEFAAKLASMNKDTVDDILNVHKKLEDKPALQNLIAHHGWSKVKVVATVAMPETENFWAEKVQIMSKEILKTFVKELRNEAHEILTNGQTGLFENIPKIIMPWPEPSTPMEASQKTAFTLKLDDETIIKLRIFKHRLEKKLREPQDWNQVMKALLQSAEAGVPKREKKIAAQPLVADGLAAPSPEAALA